MRSHSDYDGEQTIRDVPDSLGHTRTRIGKLLLKKLGKFAVFVHFHHDIATADQLFVDVELRDRRPVAVVFNALADFRVAQYVD